MRKAAFSSLALAWRRPHRCATVCATRVERRAGVRTRPARIRLGL